jgi:hypothetical protein
MKRSVVCGLVFGLLMAFPDGSAKGADRKVVLELFTSTTCGPCYNADVYLFQTWLPQSAARDHIIPIAYHVWWPGAGDPMYDANPVPVQGRVAFYQGAIYFAPRLYIDGLIDGSSTYATWAALVATRLQTASPIAISLSGSLNAGIATLRAQITAEQALNTSNLRVFWVVIEDSVSALQTNGSTYVPFAHEAAHRAILPSATGATFTFNGTQTAVVLQVIALNEAWHSSHVRVIAFVQDMGTKEILNAEEIAVSALTDVDQQHPSTPNQFLLSQNYPNPFNPSTTISYAVPFRTEVRITVHDLLGREVARLADGQQASGVHTAPFDAHGLSSGVYYYRLEAGNVVLVRPMVLVR